MSALEGMRARFRASRRRRAADRATLRAWELLEAAAECDRLAGLLERAGRRERARRLRVVAMLEQTRALAALTRAGELRAPAPGQAVSA